MMSPNLITPLDHTNMMGTRSEFISFKKLKRDFCHLPSFKNKICGFVFQYIITNVVYIHDVAKPKQGRHNKNTIKITPPLPQMNQSIC